MRYAIIMAGGTGTRFWPKSRINMPKQFLKLIGEHTMLQTTIRRIEPLVPKERILVITNAQYASIVQEQVPDLPAANIIGEPVGKNTAPVVAAAAAITLRRDPEASMAVLPSDHYIRDEQTFQRIMSAAFEKAESGAHLLTVGIRPYRPETGYGYIQYLEEHSTLAGEDRVHEVKTFAEKPDLETALRFLESGDFLWNSGMFVWQSSVIMKQFEQHLPLMHAQAEKLAADLDAARASEAPQAASEAAIHTFYESVESISIDYGIMEKAETVHVIPAEFGWNDVGSWLAVYELAEKQESGNVAEAEPVLFESSENCYVSSASGKLISVVGLQGVGVVETDDAILVCRMDKAQDVKRLVGRLKGAYGEYR